MRENGPNEMPVYEVPEGKAKLWRDLKNRALKNYEICLEHCGYEQSCIDRCEEVYRNRLADDYKRLAE